MAHFWFAFDVAAYKRKTSHLTMLQHGAYSLLLMSYYETGRPIPENLDQIIRVSGAHSGEEIEAVSYILKSFFSLESDGWHNKRADEDLAKMNKLSKLRAKSAKRRWDDKRNASAMQMHSNSTAKARTVTVTDTYTEPKSKSQAQSAFSLPDWVPQKEWQDFEEMRRKLRKPMTDRARALIVAELFKLRTRYDIAAVLEQSIRNSWQDVYELKESHGPSWRNYQIEPKPNAQAARAFGNVGAVAKVIGRSHRAAAGAGSAGVDDPGDSDSTGQTPRSAGDNARIVEGEVVGH